MEIIRQLAAVCFVLALAVAAAYWFRKGSAAPNPLRNWGMARGPKRIQVVQRVPLTTQHSLCVVRVDGREWILGLHPNGITPLDAGSLTATSLPERREYDR